MSDWISTRKAFGEAIRVRYDDWYLALRVEALNEMIETRILSAVEIVG